MQQELTRREALKRGALLAGGLAWATPVVQAVGMSPAYAQVPSPGEEVDCCIGPDGKTAKLASITMEYLGGTNFCTESDFTQDASLVSCTDFSSPVPLPNDVYIVASHQETIFNNDGTFPKPAARIWFAGSVAANTTFLVDAAAAVPPETRLKGETWIHIFSGEAPDEDNYLQKVAFHTSCSEPLFTGDQFGSVVVVGCSPDTTPEPSELEQGSEENLETQEVGEETPNEGTPDDNAPDGGEESDSPPGNKPPETPGQGPTTDPGSDDEPAGEDEPTDG